MNYHVKDPYIDIERYQRAQESLTTIEEPMNAKLKLRVIV